MTVGWPLIPRSSTGWCEMNETRIENRECGHSIEIIIERHWSSLFPWCYSIIFLICSGGRWGHTYTTGQRLLCCWGLIIIEGFGPQCLLGFLCTFQIGFQMCCSLWEGQTDVQMLGWVNASVCALLSQSTPQILAEALCSKKSHSSIQYFRHNFRTKLFYKNGKKYKLVVSVVWKICSCIKCMKSKGWANLLWIHCKSDTAHLKQY